MINKNAKFLVFLLFLLIIAIPISFAEDNSTNQTLSVSDDNEIIGANEVYFDASAITDGSGSKNSPYKTVSSSRIGTVNHFASGTYRISSSLSSMFSSSAMTFIGDDRDTTILDYTGSDTFLSSGSDMTFSSITLKGVHIVSTGGLLTASNTIFDSAVAPIEEESDYTYYDNSYGGAIKQSISSSGFDWGSIFGGSSTTGMKITDCIFRNNYAAYGGAIYVDGGTCEITGTTFESNHAENHGGSVSAVNDVKLKVDGCVFNDDYSHYDAGGAIYAFNCSEVNVKNSNFSNCSAAFGSAISSISSSLSISNSTARKNKASWQGGAVYAMYGQLTIISSSFYENAACNGGAVFADNLTSFEVNGVEFKLNTASDSAGAIFAFTNKVNKISASYNQNSANRFNDLYQTDTIDLIIGSDDYEMIKYKSSYDGMLPSKYDLRSLGYVTPVKNQGQSGNCWAYATMATLESALLKATGKQYDLSEGNLKNLANRYSDIGWDYETNNGGMYPFAFGYLTSWAGPVNETMDPTDDWDILAPILNGRIHIQNILFLQRTSFTDNGAIKKAIMDYGTVGSEIYWSNSYLHGNDYYYSGDEGRNHAVCVVGWDDSKSVSGAPGTGAWIVKNSYGPTHGDGGYYYVSYWDKSLFRVYDESYNSFAIIFNDTNRFNKNYQYDAAFTDYFMTGNKQMWYRNTFVSTGNDILEAFSTYFRRVTNWEAKIFVNDELKLTQSGKSNFGYYTIDLTTPISLKTGDNFTISLKITCNANADIPISEHGPQYTLIKEYYRPGVSFFSSDGISWTDFYGYVSSYGSGNSAHNYYNQVACIKAFTSEGSNELLNTSISIVNVDSAGVSVEVLDQYGRKVNMGCVEFLIGTDKYVSNVLNGHASVSVHLNSSIHNIGVVYLSNQHYNSSNDFKSVDLEKQTPQITIESADIVYPNDLNVKVILSNELGETVSIPFTVEINGVNYTENEFKVSRLNPGNYSVKVKTQETNDYNSNSKTKLISVSKINPTLKLEIMDVNVGDMIHIDVKVSDNITSLVNVYFNGKLHEINVVGGEGCADIDINLNAGKYLVFAELESNDYYSKANSTLTFNINKLCPELSILSDVGENITIKIYLPKDIEDTLTLTINNSFFTSKASNGEAIFTIPELNGTNNEFTIIFNGNDKYNPITLTDYVDVGDERRQDVNLTAYVNVEGNNVVVNVDLANDAGENVILRLDSQKLTCTPTNGKATFKIDNLQDGNYAIVISYGGDLKYSSSSVEKTFRINAEKFASTIVAKDSIRAYLSGNDYHATFTDMNGKPLNDTVVLFIVNGNEYYIKTNQFGVAKLNVGFPPGTFEVCIVNQITCENLTRNMTIVERITGNADVNVDYSYSANYRLRLFADNANAAGAGELVSIEINGKTTKAVTNGEGYVIYKISGLLPKTYTITAEYKGIKVSNRVVVKQILKSKNVKVKKSAKFKKFQATLRTCAGKAVKNKKIIFKIKGKTYAAKTNKNGIATIKVTQKLKVGKYTVIIKYLKTSIKRTLTIR